MIINKSRIPKSDTPRYLSYLNFGIIGLLSNYSSLNTVGGALSLSGLLASIVWTKNPFDKLLQTLFELSKESKYDMNYRNIDTFINFNEANLIRFLSTTNKNEIYFNSLSNILRTISFSYIILGRETAVNSMKSIFDPIVSDRMFHLMEKHLYPLKIPHENETDLLKNCTCSTDDIKNIVMVTNYYKNVIKNNQKKKKKLLLNFLFQSHNSTDLCATLMFALKKSNLERICNLKGTSSTMYQNPSTFMVNKRIQKNSKESLNSNRHPSYLPQILGNFLGMTNFFVRYFATGNMFKSVYPSTPDIFLINIQNMKRNTKTNTIEEIQKTSALLDATVPSNKKAYISFSNNAEIDPALVNRHILLKSKNKYLQCFFTAVRRRVVKLKWKGILPDEPIESIIIKLFYVMYGKYSPKDVGWAIEQRITHLFHNKDKLPFMIDSVINLLKSEYVH